MHAHANADTHAIVVEKGKKDGKEKKREGQGMEIFVITLKFGITNINEFKSN